MKPAGLEADRKRAARAGRRTIRRALPPGICAWIERLEEGNDRPGEVLAWAGLLTSLGVELERTYGHAGSEVRDLILRLHDWMAPSGSVKELPFPEFEPFDAWIEHTLKGDQALPIRSFLMQWIDVANERLTLRRYHRPDLLDHHAKILILRPLEIVLGPGRNDPPPFDEAAASTLLRFVDLLNVDRLAAQGKNRIAGYGETEIGGFYGVSEHVPPPDAPAIADALSLLREELAAMERRWTHPSQLRLLQEAQAALDIRLHQGKWAEDFRWRPPGERKSSPSFWRRLIGP